MSLPFERISLLINPYISARDELKETGYPEKREGLRSEYLKTNGNFELEDRISRFSPTVQTEIIGRIFEWARKVEKGALERQQPELPSSDFMDKLVLFYTEYSPIIEGEIFTKATQAKTALRGAFLSVYREVRSVDEIIEKCSISDQELQNRMRNEWTLKV